MISPVGSIMDDSPENVYSPSLPTLFADAVKTPLLMAMFRIASRQR